MSSATPRKQVKVVYSDPHLVEAKYVELFAVTPAEDAVAISCYQVVHPVLSTDEEMMSLEQVEARCVTKIVVPQRRLHELLGLLSRAVPSESSEG